MKFYIYMKTPDCVENSINDIGLNEQEKSNVEDICARWFRYGETVQLEIDTDKKSCTVVEL